MSQLVDPRGRPVGANTNPPNRETAALAHQLQVMRDSMFHMNLLVEFVVDQINTKLKDEQGFSPIALEDFEVFAERRAKEVMEVLREHAAAQKASQEQRVEIDE